MGEKVSDLRACFDFHVRSQIPLPELPLAMPAHARDVVEIWQGTVPHALEDAEPSRFGLQCRDDTALLTIEGVARFLIEGSSTVTVEANSGIAPETLRMFLLGSVMGVIGLRRGLLLLHANAVVLRGRAQAFLGHSGAGKSTLAGQFIRSGYSLLSDDVCAVRLADGRPPMAWPGVARLKLWRDSADALAHPTGQRTRLRAGFDKYSVATGQPTPEPVRLHRICLLERAEDDGECTLTRLTGHAALSALIQHSYRREYLAPLGLAAAQFAQCAEVARACEVFSLRRGWDLAGLERQVARITEQLDMMPA